VDVVLALGGNSLDGHNLVGDHALGTETGGLDGLGSDKHGVTDLEVSSKSQLVRVTAGTSVQVVRGGHLDHLAGLGDDLQRRGRCAGGEVGDAEHLVVEQGAVGAGGQHVVVDLNVLDGGNAAVGAGDAVLTSEAAGARQSTAEGATAEGVCCVARSIRSPGIRARGKGGTSAVTAAVN